MTNFEQRKTKIKKVLCCFCGGNRVFVVSPDDWDGKQALKTEHLKRLLCPM
ncbi:hypothetical protein [Nostoc commune]|uniref:hypothetical protein n=1 Tax=Nostoc commune TaxID=1178 RepID=UPI002073D8E7|nr:hypothetical protein [Nostoc commune]